MAEELRKIIELAQDLRACGARPARTSPPPASDLALPPLHLPPTPDLLPQLKGLGVQSLLAEQLQRTFEKHVRDFKSSVLQEYRQQGPALLSSLSSLDELTGRASQQSIDLLERLTRSWSRRFRHGLSCLQAALERRVKIGIATSPPKPTAGFTKTAIETLRRIYLINSYPNPAEVRAIADRISMDYKQVRVWFQNRRNRKALSARGIQEELRIAQENGLVPSKELVEQARQMDVTDAPTRKATTARKVTAIKGAPPAAKKPTQATAPVPWSRTGGSSLSEDGMDVDRDDGQISPRRSALDGATFHYGEASSLGYGRPPAAVAHCHAGSANVSPEAPSSSSSLSYSYASSSSLQAPTESWQNTTPSSTRTASPDEQWSLAPLQHDYYTYQAQLAGSLVPPQPQRAASYGSTASSPGMSDLDSLWSIASLDPSTTYSTFASAPCVPTSLDFRPPLPADELTIFNSDPAFDPPEYLLASTIPAFSFSPTPMGEAEMDFSSAEAFQALLDSSSGDGADIDATGGLLWGSGSDVLELSDEIDQVIRDFTPEGGDCGGSFSLFDFNIPPPATEAW